MARATYLDNAASTPVRPEVREAMLPYLGDDAFGNPSSAHAWGRRAAQGMDRARRQIAAALDADPGHVVFTSGGTEADNLAVIGAALKSRAAGGPFRVAVSAVEHPAVRAAADHVVSMGGESIVLPVDARGRVDLAAAEAALSQGLAVLSAMWVNNETGLIQTVDRLADLCLEYGTPFHTDAVQALGKVPLDGVSRCAMVSISGHKIGAPKGTGVLLVRDRSLVTALTHGGGQQRGIRPGTENTAGAVALGTAAELAVGEQAQNAETFRALRDRLETGLAERLPDVSVVGSGGDRAPHICTVLVPGAAPDALQMQLDLAGIACSTGSACKTGSPEPSAVLLALGIDDRRARESLRFSFYKQNTAEDVDHVLEVMPAAVERVRQLAGTLERSGG